MRFKSQFAAVVLLGGCLCLPRLAAADNQNRGRDDQNRRLALGFVFLACAVLLPAQAKKVVVNIRSYYFPIGPAELAQLRSAAPGVQVVAVKCVAPGIA